MEQSEQHSTRESDKESPQNSLLLQLVPELRNMIYDAVVQNAECFNWSQDRTFTHPLAQTCRQIRREFYDIWAEKGRKHARSLHLHCTDFDYTVLQQQLSESELAHYPHGIVFHIHLTNEWDKYLYRVRELIHVRHRLATSFALHLEDHGTDVFKGLPLKYLGARIWALPFENQEANMVLWHYYRNSGRPDARG